MKGFMRSAPLLATIFILAACDLGAGSPGASPGGGGDGETVCAGETDGYLGRICEAGTIVAFTDPAYPPQSFINEETGEYEGFDVDVTKEIAERLGVDVEFTTPTFDQVVAGEWSERWDIAVGSVTITEERRDALDFTTPYYFTPAQLIAHEDSDIQAIEDFADTTICVGEATTYLDWIEGTLTLTEEAGEVTDPPEGITATTLPTDIDCADSWRSGRMDFEGWITSSTTFAEAEGNDYPVRAVGDPIFYEPLAVVFDRAVEDRQSLVDAVDQIIQDMHEDGTLTSLSEQWFDGLDLTTQE